MITALVLSSGVFRVGNWTWFIYNQNCNIFLHYFLSALGLDHNTRFEGGEYPGTMDRSSPGLLRGFYTVDEIELATMLRKVDIRTTNTNPHVRQMQALLYMVVEDLIKSGDRVHPSFTAGVEEWIRSDLAALMRVARALGISITGTKNDLVQMLVQHVYRGN